MNPNINERTITLLMTLFQFVVTLDFAVFSPMSVDFANFFHVPITSIGYLVGGYLLASAISCFLISFFMSRVPKKKAFLFFFGFLILFSFLGIFSANFQMLFLSRILSGFFAGPATALSFSLLTDFVPKERRGQAMGKVMGGVSIALIVGVPCGLYLAHTFNWKVTISVVTFLSLLVLIMCVYVIPVKTQTDKFKPLGRFKLLPEIVNTFSIIKKRNYTFTLFASSLLFFGIFLFFPQMPGFIQFNLGFSREKIAYLYLIGGVFSFVVLRYVGGLLDRMSVTYIYGLATLCICFILFLNFLLNENQPVLPIWVFFALFMSLNASRMVSLRTLSTRITLEKESTQFQTLFQSTQNLFSALGGICSSFLITTEGTGGSRLIGMEKIVGILIITSLIIPVFIHFIEKDIKQNSNKNS